MAINVSFNGATIFKPGSYSKLNIDLGGGFALGPTGLIAIFGESTKGQPGSTEIDIANNVFTAAQVTEIRNKYGEGDLVDAVNFLFAPASDGAIPSGAQAVYIYKTNASVQASVTTTYQTITALEYGLGGNRITYKNVLTSEVAPVILGTTVPGFGVALDGAVFDIAVNGAAVNNITLGAGGHADIGSLATEVDGLMPANITVTAGSDNLIFTHDADVTAHQNGYGKAVELIETNPGDLALLGLIEAVTASSVEPASTVTINQKRDLIEESDTLGGNVVISGGYNGSTQTTASIEIGATVITLKSNANPDTPFAKSAYATIKQMVDDMNLITDWNVSIADSIYNALNPDVLDHGTDGSPLILGALSPAGQTARLKKDSDDVTTFFALSSLTKESGSLTKGLPDVAIEAKLTGGALGASLSADITNALSAFESIRVNSVVPLFSRDATADITDGLTDAASTYTVDAIHQAVKTHLSLTATTKERSERQGYLSYKASFTDSLTKAGDLGTERIQLAIQDTLNIDSQGVIKWFQPWSLACMVAGARAGSPVGTPLTFKFMNTSGARHTAQPMSTADEDIVIDFDPRTQFEQAIIGGLTFLENPQTGGFRVVVDNTTYTRDANFLKNRGNVLYASDVLVFDFRQQLEDIYVGSKNTLVASEIKSVAESILTNFLSQGITVSTDDAPQGFKSLTVAIDGNVINVAVVVKLVEGIDFILNDITVQRASSAA